MNKQVERISPILDQGDSRRSRESEVDRLTTMKAIEAQRIQDLAAEQLGIDINARAKESAAQLRSVRKAAQEALGITEVPMGQKAKQRNLEAMQDRAVQPLGYKNGQEMRRAAEAEKPGRAKKALEYLLRFIGMQPDSQKENEESDRMAS